MNKLLKTLSCLLITLSITACDTTKVKKENKYPTNNDGKLVYNTDQRDTIWGEGETMASQFFGKGKDGGESGAGIGVNGFLWRAGLDTISFMPIKSADPFGGVILTDWYENPEKQGERFKINLYILDKQLRADGVKVSIFKQNYSRGKWRDAKVANNLSTDIENTILTRAREIKIAQKSAR